jgi:lipopolysaccharide/colanic/teichoic acid biosynthesis glycosyltransferase
VKGAGGRGAIGGAVSWRLGQAWLGTSGQVFPGPPGHAEHDSRNCVRSTKVMIRTSYCGKRTLDLLLASVAIIIVSPLLLAVAVLVRILLGKPVLFRQRRPGWHGLPFTCLKFRTMRETRDFAGNLLPDADRLTRFGSFLRRTSLDELPQLWNVLRGDMSVVGPRPLLLKYLPFFTDQEQIRFTLRPGMTGWAQVHGRNQTPWDDRLRQDIWYVQNCSLWLDLRICCMTVVKIITCQHVVVDESSVIRDLDDERAQITVRQV